MPRSGRRSGIRPDRPAPWPAVGVVCFGAFMGQLDASIVTLTFRPMEHAFAAPLAAVQWVSLSYLLTLVALLAPAGRVADARGRKLVYGCGFAVFTAASAGCGLSGCLAALIGCRLAQAAGAAMLQANSIALIVASVPGQRLRLALGIQAAAQAAGLALGPTLGGLLTAYAGWRAVYWVNVPVGLAALAAARRLLPPSREFSPAPGFDWPGTVLLGTATSCLLLGLSAGSGLAMPGWLTGLLLAAGAAAAAGFVARQHVAGDPLIPLALLRSARLARALLGALAGYLVLFGPLVLIPQLLAGPGGGARDGILLSALPAGFGLAALTQDAVLPRSLGNRDRGRAGALLAAAALLAFTLVPLSPGWVVSLLAVTGLGLGVFIPANNALIVRSAVPGLAVPGPAAAGPAAAGPAGTLGGLVSMARGIGTTLGIALVTVALHLVPAAAHGARGPGSRLAFAVLAMIAASGVALGLAGRAPSGSGASPAR